MSFQMNGFSMNAEQQAVMAKLYSDMSAGNWDDMEDDETLDADEEDLEYDMDALDRFIQTSMNFEERAVPKVDKAYTETVSFTRETIDEVVHGDVTKVNAGLVNIYAAPGSGKTLDLPKEINEQQQRDVLVVVPDTVLANVAVELEGKVSCQGVNEGVKGPQDLLYMSRDAFCTLSDRGQHVKSDTLILMDEMQERNDVTMELRQLALNYSVTNRVGLMHGVKPGDQMILSSLVKCIPKVPHWDIGGFRKILVLHSTQDEVQRAATDHRSVCIIPGRLNHNVEAFKAMKSGKVRALHATPMTALGIHLPFDAIYGVATMEISPGCIKNLTLDWHFQMASRGGRHGQQTTYFGMDERIRSLKLPTILRQDVAMTVREKPVRKRSGKRGKEAVKSSMSDRFDQLMKSEKIIDIKFSVKPIYTDHTFVLAGTVTPPEVQTTRFHLESIRRYVDQSLMSPNQRDGDEILETLAGLKNTQVNCIKQFVLSGDPKEMIAYRQIAEFVKFHLKDFRILLKRARVKMLEYDEFGNLIGVVEHLVF
jgi:hypothetical protein